MKSPSSTAFIMMVLLIALPAAAEVPLAEPTPGPCETSLNGVNTADPDMLAHIIADKTKITFEFAYALIQRYLPKKDSESFAQNAKQHLFDKKVKIVNTIYIPILFSSNSLIQRSLPSSIWRSDKVIWRARAATDNLDLLNMLFDCIRIVYQPDVDKINAMSVYYRSRSAAKANLLDVANQVLNTEYALTEQNRLYNQKLLSNASPVGIVLEWFKYFMSWRESRIPWIYKSLKLEPAIASLIESEDREGLRLTLDRRLGPAVSLQYFLRHFKNLRRAVYISTALLIGPDVWAAAQYQWQIENLGIANMTSSEISLSGKYVNETPLKLEQQVRSQFSHAPIASMAPAERDFFVAVQEILNQ